MRAPPPRALALLAVGVVAVSTSGPLIREAAAPALAVSAWRNLLGSAVAAPVVAAQVRRGRSGLPPAARRRTVLAGVLLAVHFATWVPSLELTTVASSVALVTTQPVWVALYERARGRPVGRRAWVGVALALAGVVLLTGVDVTVSARALAGDLLALTGGAAAAAYVVVGASVRRESGTLAYTTACYAVAGVVLAVAALASGQELVGFDGRTWLLLAAITLGPQLLGHSVFNHLLPAVGPMVVSVAVLLEPLGAALLAWWWQGEVPPWGAVPAAALLLTGVALVAASAPEPPRSVAVRAAGPEPEVPEDPENPS